MAEFGWAVINNRGAILFPVTSTRTAAIGECVTSFDASITRRIGIRLTPDQTQSWRRLKYMGLRCARVKVEVAFGGDDAQA